MCTNSINCCCTHGTNKTKRNNSTGTITIRNAADSADVTTMSVNESGGEEIKAGWS